MKNIIMIKERLKVFSCDSKTKRYRNVRVLWNETEKGLKQSLDKSAFQIDKVNSSDGGNPIQLGG